MDHLWSPWRLAYVTRTEEEVGCVFCEALIGEEASLVVFRGVACFVILNKFPYNNGHLMVVPNRHVASLGEATGEELAELIELARLAELAVREAYAPHGLNLGINLGKPAGAGILDHLHMHVVPRWNGDTNFMTVVGETRVLPEDLAVTAERLRPVFERLRTAAGRLGPGREP
jgi:ATP adenylyltransferase